MRVILDTNVLISAIFSPASLPADVLAMWYKRIFEILTAEEQIEEMKNISRYPRLANRLKPAHVGRLVNDLRKAGMVIDSLPELDISSDPFDNYLLAIAEKGEADFLVSGDKSGLLALGKHKLTKIVSVRQFADLLAL